MSTSSTPYGGFPGARPRRLRTTEAMRRMVAETRLHPAELILPAFGSLTGGLDAHHPEIVRAVGPGAQALIPLTDRLLRFPIAA